MEIRPPWKITNQIHIPCEQRGFANKTTGKHLLPHEAADKVALTHMGP